jgi:plastocyanin
MRSWAVLLSFVSVMVALSLPIGCAGRGGGEGGNGSGGGEEALPGAKDSVVKTIRIEETEFRLEPAEITLDKPGTYVLEAVNSGDTVHALEVEGQGIEEKTEEIQPGQNAKLGVELAAGTYELYCPVGGHKEEGMEGTLTVKEGSGGSGGY